MTKKVNSGRARSLTPPKMRRTDPAQCSPQAPLVGPEYADSSFIRRDSTLKGLGLNPTPKCKRSVADLVDISEFGRFDGSAGNLSAGSAATGVKTSLVGFLGFAKDAFMSHGEESFNSLNAEELETEETPDERRRRFSQARRDVRESIESSPDALRQFKEAVKRSGTLTSSGASLVFNDQVSMVADACKREKEMWER